MCRSHAFLGLFTVALIGAGIALAAQENASSSRAPDPQAFFYLHSGAAIRLAPSEVLAASFARDELERGAAATPPPGLVLDPRSSRSELADRGLTLFRVAPTVTPKGLEPPPRRPPWLAVLDAGLAGQPVFEQGAALKIPTGQVIVAFDRELSADEARAALRSASETLKWESIVPLRAGTWLATLRNAAGGRAFEASRALAALPNVVFAEPNFIDIFLDTPAAAPELPSAPAKPTLGTITGIETPPGVKVLASWERPPLDSAWQDQVDGAFEADWGGWMAAREDTAARTAPIVTEHRAHGGRRSVYMTAADLAGRKPPGPYPENANSYLFSPAFDLSDAEEAYVELWFWARLEDPLPAPRVVYDYGRVLLFDMAEGAFVLAVPLAPDFDSGDMTRDPLTDRGWRRLLFRVPVALRSRPLQLVVQFVSDGSGAAEGLYVDDIRVLMTRGKPGFTPADDPLVRQQYVLASNTQIAGRPAATDPAVRAAAAWKAGFSYGDLRIALLDDGVERGHPDLALVEGDGTEEALPPGEPLNPEDRHGTACAGVLGAVANNAAGIAGVAPGAPVLSIRRGVDDASIALAIDEAVRRRARILLLPWGWSGAPSATITRAIGDAIAAGTIVVAAAGDAGGRVPDTGRVDFPCILGASTPLICVGASSPAGEPKGPASADGLYWWSSKTGDREPAVLAPGTWLLATDRRGAIGYNDGSDRIAVGWTGAFGGTGAAACVVAGVATLVLSHDPALNPAETKALLLRTSSEAVSGKGRRGGDRIVNAEAAVRAAVESAERRKAPEGLGVPPEALARP
jgi:subtilisin family serine protease